MSGTAALARPAPGDAPSRPASGTAPRDAAAASDPAPGAVTFRGASKRYGTAGPGRPALHGIDAVVPTGGVFGIIGRSGAGKSTLLRLINGLERPTGGQVLVDGQDVAGLDTAGLVALRRRIGMVFQHFNLLAAKTVFGNVALPLAVAGVDRAEIARRVGDMLALVGLEDKRDVHPSRLSGGQKQRVGIARALVGRPSMLLCDEATSALDPDATLSILRLLKDVNRRLGITIVLITHEMSVIREICDRVLVLEAGVAVETGPVWRVFGEPRHDATRALLNPAGRGLPPDLEARLRPTAPAGRRGAALVAFGFTGRTEPDLADLVARLGGPLRLVHGGLDRVDGRSQGRLLVAVPLSPGGSLPDLTGLAQTQEVLGYVADDG